MKISIYLHFLAYPDLQGSTHIEFSMYPGNKSRRNRREFPVSSFYRGTRSECRRYLCRRGSTLRMRFENQNKRLKLLRHYRDEVWLQVLILPRLTFLPKRKIYLPAMCPATMGWVFILVGGLVFIYWSVGKLPQLHTRYIYTQSKIRYLSPRPQNAWVISINMESNSVWLT